MADFSASLKPSPPFGPDLLAKERGRSKVPVQQLSQHLLNDGFLERQQRVLEEMQKEPLLSKAAQMQLARPDRYKLSLARSKLLRRMSDRLNWSLEDYRTATYLVDEMAPYELHMSMFYTTIKEQASDEQQRHWLPLIENWKIIGSYGQTELGHGSNVRGLETTATYDPKTKEFVMHSPTLTASKWWNGSLGRTATHSIVVAQLLLPDANSQLKSYGPHPFIIEVRDLKTHEPHEGIIIGDIGPKVGYSSMDNAYMLFKSYRVPHSAFLARYSKVDPSTGAYTKPENAAVVYGSMTGVRAMIIMQARLILARAVTIAVRYLSIRRQFPDRDAKDKSAVETVVLDYPTVQIRVLPLLATTFALHYTGAHMSRLYAETRERVNKGDYGLLAELHAESSGLKSMCTTYAADGIETCRRALGGHGFGGTSGLVELSANYLSKPTVEGDNWMITQQTAAHLIKVVSHVLKQLGTTRLNAYEPKDATEAAVKEYLVGQRRRNIPRPYKVLTQDAHIVKAFERRSTHLAVQLHSLRIGAKRPWTSLMLQQHAASNAHSQTMLVRNFHAALYPSNNQQSEIPAQAWPALRACFRLFATQLMAQHALEFLSAASFKKPVAEQLGTRVQALLREVRPHAVALVDAWAIPDYLLNSALGRADGKVYEALWLHAHHLNPLNWETMNPWYWEEEVVQGQGPYKMPYEHEIVRKTAAAKL